MILKNWKKLSVLKKISLLIIIITCLIIGISYFVYFGYVTNKINGPIYLDIIEGKDLIADILPPPEYIVEPYQISLELLEERNTTNIHHSITTLRDLQAMYLVRHEYWEKTLPPGLIRDKMVNTSYIHAMEFWEDVNLRFIPAILEKDYVQAKTVVFESMKVHYNEHRKVIDEIVSLANEQNLLNEQIASEKENLINYGMIGIAILLFLTLIFVELIILHLLRPLNKTTRMIEEMSLGHLSMRLNLDREDEIGKMGNAMDKLADYLQDTFHCFSRLARGDLSMAFKAKDEYDEIAPAFNQLITQLHKTMNELKSLLDEAEAGKLKTRGKPAQFEGIYLEIIEGINNLLDAITIPLNEALRVAEEFSYARFSTRFDDNIPVKGDLIALKEGLNKIGEELSVVRYKFSLLSSITRHDILNQITVVKSGLDVIEDELEIDDSTEPVLQLVRSAISNIKEQISFTALYEQMGVQHPVWHSVSAIIEKTRLSINTGSIVISDKTQDLEIFADPLFGQVVYNLVDNALRHGKSLTEITFSFEPSGEEGILIMSDNGVGIADDDKRKIFQRGFGKNTGLGLFLIQEILSFTQMTIRETGTVGKGARFEIHISAGKWRMNPSVQHSDS